MPIAPKTPGPKAAGGGRPARAQLTASVVDQVEPLSEFRLFSWGVNDTEHGPFTVTKDDGAAIVAAFEKRGTKLSFDYSHDESKKNVLGPKLAAGWCSLEAKEDGIWCTQIQYTPRAMAHVREQELKYFSPWFDYVEGEDGAFHVTNVINCALTNIPATHDIEPIAADAAGAKQRGRSGTLIEIRNLAATSGNAPRGVESKHRPTGRRTADMATKAEMLDMIEQHKQQLNKMCEMLEEMSPSDAGDKEPAAKEDEKADAKPFEKADEKADAIPPAKKEIEDGEGNKAPGAKVAASVRAGVSAALAAAAGTSDEREIAAQLAAGQIALSRLGALEGEVAALSAVRKESDWAAAVAEGNAARKLAPGMVEGLASVLGKDAKKLRALLATMPALVSSAPRTPGKILPASGSPEASELTPAERRMAASNGVPEELIKKYLSRSRAALTAPVSDEEELAMTAMNQDRDTAKMGSDLIPRLFDLPVAAGAIGYGGGIVCLNASGYAVNGSTATSLKVVGRARFDYNATGMVNGAITVKVEAGCFKYLNSSGADLLALIDQFNVCYLVDDQTVAKTDAGGTRSQAGVVYQIDSDGVWVLMGSPGVLANAATGSPPGRARAVATSITAYTASGTGVLTMNANGALANQDGVSTLAVGDVLFLPEGLANLGAAKDAGPYEITSLGGASSKVVLTRPAWYQTGSNLAPEFAVVMSADGTVYAGAEFRSFAPKGSVVDTNAPLFIPGRVTQPVTLVAGTVTVSNVPILSATKTSIAFNRTTPSGTASTVSYNASTLTPGALGVGSLVFQAQVAAGTINASDVSTGNLTVINF